ncbi:MAG TPA: hypothetical protein PKZ19_07800 [Zoogloea sp.]|nr:hypothetical protein [Zoogloea sp.]
MLPLSLALAAVGVHGADVTVSGFGTLGYALSDTPYSYQRFIEEQGTFDRDSRLALQVDTALSRRWSATAQFKFAPDEDSDSRWAPRLSWGFLSWRPNDDWLLRVGKLRIPMYLGAESMDVGVSFDYARLPIEVYSIAPTQDFTGASVTRSWDVGRGELSVDGYWGKTRSNWRQYARDGVPGYLAAGPVFASIDVVARGLALTYRNDGDQYRIGVHEASSKLADGTNWVDRPVLISPLPGVAYYNLLPGPGMPERRTMDMVIANAAMDVGLGRQVRLGAEYAVRQLKDMDRGVNSSAGYVSLRRRSGAWTPYVYYAWLRSDQDMVDLYHAVNGKRVPAWVPQADLINLSQRATADGLEIHDQQTWAVGSAYALTPSSKLKAEWARTRVGSGSSLVDAPAGSDVRFQSINVFSLSYSFVF